MGIQLKINDIYADFPTGTDVTAEANEQARRLDARLVRHWSIDYLNSDPGVDELAYLGGPIVSDAGAVSMGSAGTITLTDNATNYVERTHAGVVSVNTSGFTADREWMYKITVASHVWTAIEDWRSFPLAALRLTGGILTGFLTLHSDPSSSMHAATKNYVDLIAAALAAGFTAKRGRARSTANVDVANPASATYDGVTLATGDRLFLAAQTAPAENGLYTFNGVGVALTRTTDANTWTELVGNLWIVEEGTAWADTLWLVTVNQGGTLGTTAVTFTQFGITGPHTHTATDISDSSAAGRALLTAADEDAQRAALNVEHYTIPIVIGDGVNVIPTGFWADLPPIDIPGEIEEVTMLANEDGDLEVDLYKCTFAQFDAGATHPVAGDSIVASAPPTITADNKSQDSTLTGWDPALAVGDILRVWVNTATDIKQCTLSLKVRRT